LHILANQNTLTSHYLQSSLQIKALYCIDKVLRSTK
jgi:hypothetical protein